MPTLPKVNGSLLVRTAFADQARWEEIAAAAQAESEEGFAAYVLPVSDPDFDGVHWRDVRAAVPANPTGAMVLFIVDAQTLSGEDSPILVVDLSPSQDEPQAPFRCIPSELWGIENNLNIANMDWEDFAGAADQDGVFRGFPPPPPPTPEQLRIREEHLARLAAAKAEAAADGERRRRVSAEQMEQARWGGHTPSPALRSAGRAAPSLARLDSAVAEALVDLDERTQREVMLWAVHEAVNAADERYRILLAPAVAALERGEPVPAPFDSPRDAWAALLAGEQLRAVVTVHRGHEPPGPRPRVAAHAAALSAILAATTDDSVSTAMIVAVDAAARAWPDPSAFFALLRETFDRLE